ncbi:MAG TPA: S53 family peptidase [Streptosporangiaceae bacterium]
MAVRSTRRLTVVTGVSALLAFGLSGAAAASVGGHSSGTVITGVRPSWATSARDVGAAAASNRVNLRVWLSLRDPGAVAQLVKSVSNPASPMYGRYLTPAQFNAKYAPTAAQASAVASWLRSTGLQVTAVPSTHRYVAASGAVSQVQRAFGVTLNNYTVGARTWRAPANNPTVPSSLASTVLTVTGLDTGDHSMHPASTRPPAPPAGFRNSPPFSTNYGDNPAQFEADGTTPLPQFQGQTLPYVVKGYTPPALRSAYGAAGSGLDGAGTTVAITDAYFAGTIVSDANQYLDNHDPGSPHLVEGTNYFQSLPPSFSQAGLCDASGWEGEETLDVEAVHGIAPQATIKYFAASSCQDTGFLDALTRVVSDGSVDVVTNSWAGLETQETPGITAAYETIFQQGIAEGMTFSFSSGDDGDELAATGTKQVDYPSSDPYVTSAGGTSIGVSNGAFFGQTGWGTMKATLGSSGWGTPAFLYGAGGGCSTLFNQPAYQAGTANATSLCGTARAVPDISMDADPNTGFLVGETQTFPHHVIAYDEYRIGGTSLASPLFAGMLALADQAAANGGHGSIANANVLLYSLSTGIDDVLAQGQSGLDIGNVRADYANTVDASAGTVYSVRTFDHDSSLTTGPGWDDVTGLGTLNGGVFAALASAAP